LNAPIWGDSVPVDAAAKISSLDKSGRDQWVQCRPLVAGINADHPADSTAIADQLAIESQFLNDV